MSLFEEVDLDKLEGAIRSKTAHRRQPSPIAPKPPQSPPRIYHGERVVMVECEHCGWHEITQKVCVWSIECPECKAGPRQFCKYPSGRVTTLHKERWEKADELGQVA